MAVAGRLVEVEVDLASGFPGFATVGLRDNIVKAPRYEPEANDT